MKLKTLLSLAALMATTASFAVTSDTVLCRIEVNSGTKSTILSLPLEGVGTEANKIAVTDLVMTDNLENGDTLMVVSGATKYCWEIQNGTWTPVRTVDGYEDVTAGDSQTALLDRGDAVWVNRKGNLDKSFYLYGQIAQTPANNPNLTQTETDGTPVFTLVGNPNPDSVDLNDTTKVEWVANVDDQLIWGSKDNGLGFVTYTYGETGWGVNEEGMTQVTLPNGQKVNVGTGVYTWKKVDSILLPPGQGFWYVSRKTGGSAPSLTWK